MEISILNSAFIVDDLSIPLNSITKFSAKIGIVNVFYGNGDNFATKKNKTTGGGDATDFIFNAGTVINAQLWASADNKTASVWLAIQDI